MTCCDHPTAWEISRDRHREKVRTRQIGLGKALDMLKAQREALEKTRAALRLLQPAMNVEVRMCLDDIIEREIDSVIGPEAKS